MVPMKSFLAAALAAATLALPAQAAVMSATCTVTVNYSLNNTLVEGYSREFSVAEGAT